jgi:CzcA family heavy metal efflux pump
VLTQVIAFSLRNRAVVLLAACLAALYGAYRTAHAPVDVFPDLDRPVVTVLTESPGLAPPEVETLVTRPLEYLLNGATGVRRVRSSSAAGLSVVWVEFDWGSDVYRDRQVVAEKLQLARERLPEGVNPILAPISSIMGEVMLVGLRWSKEPGDGQRAERMMDLRTAGEFTVRNRLMAVEGVAQVTVLGGILRQYQVLTTPERLLGQDVTLQQLTEAARKASVLAGGGVLGSAAKESLIRIDGQATSLEEIGETVVLARPPRPVRIRDVADVKWGGPIPRGDGGVRFAKAPSLTPDPSPRWGEGRQPEAQAREAKGTPPPKALPEAQRGGAKPEAPAREKLSLPPNPFPESQREGKGGSAVILTVQKQPGADTLELTPRIEQALAEVSQDLPAGILIDRHIFRQADFIRRAIDNVVEAIRDGTVWVFVVLVVFLASIRASLVTLTAIPLSLLTTAAVFHHLGVSINTMTLGGIAVAVGELVDDAIVDVENIYRRLKENRLASNPKPVLEVVFNASQEVRGSIVYATLIVCVVVLPLFALAGLEGRMFAPLGLAYLVSLVCSLVVSLTVTPALASLLLPGARILTEKRDPWLLRQLKRLDEKVLRRALEHPRKVLVGAMALALLSKLAVAGMGSEFLPAFQEGTLTVNVQTEPGTSLAESVRVAGRAEELLLGVPEVLSVARRTGRAEQDEHAEGVHSSELEVRLVEPERPLPGAARAVLRAIPGLQRWGVEETGRPHGEVTADVRERLSALPGVKVNIGQPISHRLDHLLSGVRAQVAVKVFGTDLSELRAVAQEVEGRLAKVPGVVDLQTEPQVEVPQVVVRIKRREAARHGLTPGDLAALVETALRGRRVATLVEQERTLDLVVWYEESARSDVEQVARTILETPSGSKVALSQVADVLDATGPNTINRERVQRRVVVSCNVQGRDAGATVLDVEKRLASVRERLADLGAGWRIQVEGQFEARREANSRLAVLGTLAVLAVFVLLWRCLGSWRAALQVLLVNLPLAALGSVVALLLVNRPSAEALASSPWYRWPEVWAGATTLSLAHWVGFITLIGIVSRNGILMISHYIHLMKHEGMPFGKEMIVRGSLERLAPVLMTSLVAILGLLPLALGSGQPGKEILHPLAIVVIGGLLDSTLMDQVVTPVVFHLFGAKVYRPGADAALP